VTDTDTEATNAVVLDAPDQITAVRAYQATRDYVDALNAQLKEAKEELDKAERRVLDLYGENGLQSVRLDGRLVYLIRNVRVRASKGREDDLVDALVDNGHDELARRRVLPQTLTAWWRECERDEVPIPDAIREHVEVAEMFTLGMRRG
jgi:hypothetical protein